MYPFDVRAHVLDLFDSTRPCVPQTSDMIKQFDNNYSESAPTAMDDSKCTEWTCGQVLELIQEYGRRRALWDPECEDYKNKITKHHHWLELAAIFKCSKLEVERKMKILNSQYRRERRNAIKMKKLGKTHRVTWYGYRAFAFMNKHLVRYKNRNNLMAANDIKEEIPDDQDHFSASETELLPFLDEDEQEDTPCYNESISEPVVENKEKDNLKPQNKDFGANILLCDNKDEWTLFGEMVTLAFRKFPDDKTRCIVKHKINTVLFEAELATYGNNEVSQS